MLERLTARKEWKFFGVLPKADARAGRRLVDRAPAAGRAARGLRHRDGRARRRRAARRRRSPVPLALVGVVFVLLQVLSPIHQAISANLGDRTAAWLYDRLTEACVRPPGMGHSRIPTLTSDLTVARDFDLGMTGPPLSISMDFIASGLVEMIGGLASAVVLVRYAWWAPLVLAGAWLATHWLLRESAVWRDRNTDEVRGAQRDADYAYRLAVDPPASKELRLFGLADWTIDRFVATAHAPARAAVRGHAAARAAGDLEPAARRLPPTCVVFWSLAAAAAGGPHQLGEVVVYAQSAVGVSMIAFGGFNWALDGAAAPVAAVLRLEPAMRPPGALRSGRSPARTRLPAREIRFRDVTFAYPSTPATRRRTSGARALRSHHSRRLVARDRRPERRRQDDAREAAVPSVRPAGGRDRGRRRRPARVRSRVVALARRPPCSRTSSASSCRCATTSRRRARPTTSCARRSRRPAPDLAALDTVLARGYDGGTDLSGGQWQRVALARALCAVTLGAGVVLLDEPTAQLDVRGEAEIFDRMLAATRHCTTILISHRFSTVRHADRICVLEHGRVIELGTHDELMALGGRYRTMFDLQAQRFPTPTTRRARRYDVLA